MILRNIATAYFIVPVERDQTGIRPMKDDLGVNQRQLRTFADLRGQPGLLSSDDVGASPQVAT